MPPAVLAATALLLAASPRRARSLGRALDPRVEPALPHRSGLERVALHSVLAATVVAPPVGTGEVAPRGPLATIDDDGTAVAASLAVDTASPFTGQATDVAVAVATITD